MNEWPWIYCAERDPSVEEIRKKNLFLCSDGYNTYVRSYSYRLHGFVMELRGRESKDRSILAWMTLPGPCAIPEVDDDGNLIIESVSTNKPQKATVVEKPSLKQETTVEQKEEKTPITLSLKTEDKPIETIPVPRRAQSKPEEATVPVVETIQTEEPIKIAVQETEPVQVVQPIQEAEPVQAVQPIQEAEPVQTAQPVQEEKPVQIADPIKKIPTVQMPAKSQPKELSEQEKSVEAKIEQIMKEADPSRKEGLKLSGGPAPSVQRGRVSAVLAAQQVAQQKEEEERKRAEEEAARKAEEERKRAEEEAARKAEEERKRAEEEAARKAEEERKRAEEEKKRAEEEARRIEEERRRAAEEAARKAEEERKRAEEEARRAEEERKRAEEEAARKAEEERNRLIELAVKKAEDEVRVNAAKKAAERQSLSMQMERIAPRTANMTPQERIAAAEAAQKAAQEAARKEAMELEEALNEASEKAREEASKKTLEELQEELFATPQPEQETGAMSVAQQRIAAMEAAHGGEMATSDKEEETVESEQLKEEQVQDVEQPEEEDETAIALVKAAQQAARESLKKETDSTKPSAPMSVAQQRLAAMEAANARKDQAQQNADSTKPSAPMSVAQQRLAAMEAARGGKKEEVVDEPVTEKSKKKGFGFRLKF